MANQRSQLKVAHHSKAARQVSTAPGGRPVTRRADRRAASGCTERDYAAPAVTDSRQRRFSTQFLPKEATQRSRDGVSPGHGCQLEGSARVGSISLTVFPAVG